MEGSHEGAGPAGDTPGSSEPDDRAPGAGEPGGGEQGDGAPSAGQAGDSSRAAGQAGDRSRAAGQAGDRSPGVGGTVGPPPAGQAIRASDRERDDVVHKLQDAFAEGRLSDDEFDQRMHGALAARTRADLDHLLADLPAAGQTRQAASAAERPADSPLAIAIKGSVRRSGRWRVPHRLTTFAYKGDSQVDLRAAELTAQVTIIRAVGYKSDVEIIVPPGLRVVVGGFGVSRDDAPEGDLPPDAPMVHVRGFAYKGNIEIRAMPRSR